MSTRNTRLSYKVLLDSSKEINHETKNVTKKTTVTSLRSTRSSKIFQTSDYSSEGETEVTSSTRHLKESDKARIIQDAKAAATEEEPITALGFYRKAKSYWEKYPKTDWTYSPYSKDRVEIAPGVVAMPNMSRRHIRSYSEKFDENDLSYSDAYYSKNKYGSYYESQDFYETNIFHRVYRKIVSWVFTSFIVVMATVWASTAYVFQGTNRLSMGVMKFVHRIASRVMVLDTWILQRRGQQGRKNSRLLMLCLIPLLIFGALHVIVVNEITPSCHPKCGHALYLLFDNLVNFFKFGTE